jgi:hypothetical protein
VVEMVPVAVEREGQVHHKVQLKEAQAELVQELLYPALSVITVVEVAALVL